MIPNINNKILAIPVNQNQQEFMIGIFTIQQMLQFTMYSKRIIVDFDEDGLPIYNKQIQRDVEISRVEKIADFLIEDSEAVFPTNIVLHIPQQAIEKQEVQLIINNKFIEITLDNRVFEGIKKERLKETSGDIYITIIDGQHRIKGIEVAIKRLEDKIKSNSGVFRLFEDIDIQKKLEYYQRRLKDLYNIQIVVSFFIDKTIDYQAMIFSTINRTQKRVSESLVYSLFGLTNSDSPQRSSLQITLALNAHPNSPFFNRIKLYGGTYERHQSPSLSQATMVKSIIDLICENSRESELDRYRDREKLKVRPAGTTKLLPFRKYYANNLDTSISNFFFNYFNAVKETFIRLDGTSYWDFNPENMKPTNVLQTTVGYLGLLDLLVEIIDINKKIETKSDFSLLLSKAKELNFEDNLRYPFTSKTRKLLYLDLSIALFPPTSDSDERLVKREEALRET